MAPLYSCQECCVTNCSVAFIFRSDSVLYHYLLIFFFLSFLFTPIALLPYRNLVLSKMFRKDLDIWSCLKPFSMDKMCSWMFVTGQISGTFWVDWMSYVHFRQDQISANLNIMLGFFWLLKRKSFFVVVVIKTNRKKHVGN